MRRKQRHTSISPAPAGGLHLYTGNGKGKTTAAIGQAVRASGWGWRILFARFLKDADAPSGEVRILSSLPGVAVLAVPVPVPSFAALTAAERDAVTRSAADLLALLRQRLAGDGFDLIVLDELCVALSLGCLDRTAVEELLDTVSGTATVVATGRDAPQWLIDRADLVTEMRALKHPFDEGTAGTEGVEW